MSTEETGTEADDALALDRQLCFAVYAAANAFNRFYKPLLEPLGLTYPQYLAMLVLWEADGVSVSGLGLRLGLDSGTLTPLLKRLETAGLVDRTRSAADERQVIITLTEAGRALRVRAARVPAAAVDAVERSRESLETTRLELEAMRRRLIQAAGDTLTSSEAPRRSRRR